MPRVVRSGDLVGLPLFVGFDLAQTRDLTAFAFLWADEDEWLLRVRFWAPEDGVWKLEHQNRRLYRLWADSGHLALTPGEVTDYQVVEEDVVERLDGHDVRAIWGDKQGALNLGLRLRDVHGYEVQFPSQTPMNLNDPSRELERRILAGTIVHDGNPVMDACIANAVVRENSTGLIQPDKARATGRIDGVAATINAIAAARATIPEVGVVDYEGLTVL